MLVSRLFDNHNRPLNYLRLAVTDRCNLRCFYCMPAEGIRYLPKTELLTFPEIQRIITIVARLGISKIRLTGGEPFVRQDLMPMIRMITATPGIEDVHLTTNGILTGPYVHELKQLGIASVNVSLDTLDRRRFHEITRRDEFDAVWKTVESLLQHHLPLKLNVVVMEGKNTEDILTMAALTRIHPVSVRFIEEMPFNGEGNHYASLVWTHKKILSHLLEAYPNLERMADPENSTASHFRIPGHAGTIGIIAGFTRTFCGTCNRIRITAQGILKTCLYDDGVLNLRDLLRSGVSDTTVEKELLRTFRQRPANGFEAEALRQHHLPIKESMSTIGG